MNISRTAILIGAGVALFPSQFASASETGLFATHGEELQEPMGADAQAGLVYVPATVSAGLQEASQAQPVVESPKETLSDELVRDTAGITYGSEGTTWWSITGGIGTDFIDSTDYNLAGSITHFVVDDLEVGGELGVWYHNQPDPEDDVGSANLLLVFRWHFLNRDKWTLFADAGIGMFFASEDLPEGGTQVGFTPRLGVGFTHQLGESQNRLIVGVRWAHFSNARINGDDENPGIDDAFFYGGVMFPF